MVDKLNEENISLNYFFNIDGIGHKFIQDQISFYNINNALESEILQLQKNYGISKGPQWPQGLHGIYAQHGIKCFAITSQSLDVHHTPEDTFALLDVD